MESIEGIYENGVFKLDKSIKFNKPVKVIVTFLDKEIDEDTKRLTINDFSFLKVRQLLSNYKGSLSDAIIKDRR